MKKMLAMVLAVAMLMSIASVASASTYFSLSVQCKDTTTYSRHTPAEHKSTGSAAIFVRHYDNVDTDEYTNHFRGQEGNSKEATSWTTRGSKWCTQYMEVPIQNNNIQAGTYKYYTVSARGNTNYYEYDGVSRITLEGRFNPNSTVVP